MKKVILIIFMVIVTMPSLCMAVGNDKFDHASACFGAEAVVKEAFPKWTPFERWLFVTGVIGGGKEWYDSKHPDNHSAEWGDIAADAVGAAGYESTIWLIHKTW